MLYKEVPYHKIYMKCERLQPTDYTLADGYTLVNYPQATKEDWCNIQLASGHIKTYKEAQRRFDKEFGCDPKRSAERLLFVLDEHNTAVGTIALWKGEEELYKDRLHWLGVCDAYAGKGIAKYLVQEACKLADGTIYLDSQTWSYPAIHIYRTFGFVPWNPYDALDYQEAWELIDAYCGQ